jgi:hypothetical protein
LLTTKTLKGKGKDRNQQPLWNETPSLGREAMIAMIEDQLKLINILKAENKEEYNKIYFTKQPSYTTAKPQKNRQNKSHKQIY